MVYSLFIDLSLLPAMDQMTRSRRARFEAHLQRIRDYPMKYSVHSRFDAEGRLLRVSLLGDLAIYYWVDEADRHVKVMRLASRASDEESR